MKHTEPVVVKNVYRYYRDETVGILIVEDKKGTHLAEIVLQQLAGEPKVVA